MSSTLSTLSSVFCSCHLTDDCKTASKKPTPERIPVLATSKSFGSTGSMECTDRSASATKACHDVSFFHHEEVRVHGEGIDIEVSKVVDIFKGARQPVVRRIGDGQYDVDGRRIRLSLSGSHLVVQEDFGITSKVSFETYLQQAAFVSDSLHGGGSAAVARLPREKRPTFAQQEVTSSRIESMLRACHEARIREEAAQAFTSDANGTVFDKRNHDEASRNFRDSDGKWFTSP